MQFVDATIPYDGVIYVVNEQTKQLDAFAVENIVIRDEGIYYSYQEGDMFIPMFQISRVYLKRPSQ